jgi:hypothetical protein
MCNAQKVIEKERISGHIGALLANLPVVTTKGWFVKAKDFHVRQLRVVWGVDLS